MEGKVDTRGQSVGFCNSPDSKSWYLVLGGSSGDGNNGMNERYIVLNLTIIEYFYKARKGKRGTQS